ncbi:KAP family NTPase [Patescibacteria group bacterium]|nr:KAP family NTPase [Patescibacteria group bacterium]
MTEKLKFKFLKDAPLGNEDGVVEFYHNKVAPALQEILENDSCVHTIGLFSKWGTGKSTVIEMIRDKYEYPMFVFDAWKYQDDSLRRIFLIKLVEFLNNEGEKIDPSILDPLHKTTEIREEVTVSNEESKKQNFWEKIKSFLKANWLFVVAILLLLIWVSLETYFSFDNFIIQTIKNFAAVVGSFSLLGVLLIPIFEKIWKRSVDKFLSSLGPLSTIKTKVEKEERLNSPEQFEILFQKIVEKINKRVVIVFDNIDRVQGDTAIKILSTIKTFLDPKNVAGLTFIVPCDSDAINNQIKSFYKDKDDDFDSSEYLRKLFNLIIWMPEFIESDLHAFINKIIEDTGEIKKLLQHEDVAFVIGSAFSNNPREIKQFINNLISALVLASKTEVWDRIKDGVPYLAKVLILKQKYPTAYQRLKEKWFEPENILQDKDENGLRNFMLNTSRITIDNAEPFIYFKEPTISGKLTNSVDLTLALVEGDKEKAKEIIEKEQDNTAVVDFVELLLRKYRSQKDLQKNIFSTHLEIFSELKVITQKKLYYETLARTLDTDLWQFFAQLPTNLIFSSLLTKNELDDQFRKPLVKRYALALDSEDARKPDSLELVKNILINLKQNFNLVDKETIAQISKSIDEHFSNNFEIISLFEKLKEQEDFVTPQAFEKFITNIDEQTFLKDKEMLSQFKEFIIKKKKFGVILQKITELIQKETSKHPDYRAEKETFMKAIGEIFSEFEAELGSADDGIKIQLIKQFTQAFNGIGAWDNRTSFVNNLRWLHFAAPEAQKNELQNLINTYCQQATASKIQEVLDYWEKKSVEGFIDDFFPSFLQKSMIDDAYLDMIYKRADKSKKLELITNLINQKGANSLNFIKTLDNNLPDRQAIIKNLISKLPSIPFDAQVLIYDYLPNQLSKNDPADLKEQIVNQIKTLLKSDNLASQEAGLNFLTNTDSLSEEKRREIGKEVLDWLRQPGKILNSSHRFVLKSVASLVVIMQETLVSDFTYTLFDMLKQDRDKATLDVSLEILNELNPKYPKYEKDFKDLLDRLKEWPQNENKNLVIEKIKNLKSSNSNKEEKQFWKEIDSLINQNEE